MCLGFFLGGRGGIFFSFFLPEANLVQLEHGAQQMSNVGVKWSMLTRERSRWL